MQLKIKSILIVFFAFFYLAGRIGFVSSTDYFTKSRPNRAVILNMVPQADINLQTRALVVQKQTPQRLPALPKRTFSALAIDVRSKLSALDKLSSRNPYSGIFIAPPPL